MKFKKIKTNKRIKNKTNSYLFYLFTVIVISLSVGYSAINSDLSISGEATFRVLKDLRITDVRLYETTFNGEERYNSKFTKDSITLGVDLKEVQSTVTYLIEVTNYGTVAMTVDSISESSNSNINATTELIGYNKTDLINPGESRNIYVKIKYKEGVTTLPSITTVDLILGFEYVTPESTLAAGNNGAATSTFFNNGPIKRNEVESIEFLPTLEVGEDALGYWDASYKKDQTVIAWYTDEDEDNLYELYIGGNGKVYAYSNAYRLFQNFNKVESIEFGEYFDTSNVVGMYGMFYRASSLTSLDLSSFDTSNVTNMSFLFAEDGANFMKLQNISFGNNFKTSKVTNMERMFYGCGNLESLNVSEFNTTKVTNMSMMFDGCSKLTTLDVSNFNTENVTNMAYMFSRCSRLNVLDVSSFNTSKVTTMGGMFGGYWGVGLTKLESLIFGKNFNTENVTDMSQMFYGCSTLTELDLIIFNTSKVTNMSMMFYGCSSLASLDIRNFTFTNVTTNTSMFASVPVSSEIIVKTDAERDWIHNNVSSNYTNIKTVAELPTAYNMIDNNYLSFLLV